MNLYIADTHFGHGNVIRFDGRPFLTADEMDSSLISYWQAKVCPEDDVWFLGDLAYRSRNSAEWYLRQLPGHKHLIVGNHDGELLKNRAAMSCFESVDQMKFIKDGEENVVMCHYPVAEWNGMFRGTYLVYGHIHNQTQDAYRFMKTRDRALNAGCMLNRYAPASLAELIENNAEFKRTH